MRPFAAPPLVTQWPARALAGGVVTVSGVHRSPGEGPVNRPKPSGADLTAAVLAARCLEYCALPGVYEAFAKWDRSTTGRTVPNPHPPPPPGLMREEARRLMIGAAEAMGMLGSGGGDGTLN